MTSIATSNSSDRKFARIVLAIGTGIILGFACIAGDWFSAGFAFLIIFTSYLGYCRGAIKTASLVLGVLAGIRFDWVCSPLVTYCSDRFLDVSESWRELIDMVAAGVLVSVVVIAAIRIAAHFILKSKPRLKSIDRWLGAIAGVVEGVAVSALILIAAMILEPVAEQHVALGRGEQAGSLLEYVPDRILAFSQRARQSTLGPIMDAMTPMLDRFHEKFPEINDAIAQHQGSDGP